LALLLDACVKIHVLFGVWFERRNVDKKANRHENWSMRTLFYSLLNIWAKFHQNRSYNFQLYRFKVGAFLGTQCSHNLSMLVIPALRQHLTCFKLLAAFAQISLRGVA